MSMNVYITAVRKITFKKKNGKTGTEMQTVEFAAWQTPTNFTYKIVSSANPVQAYIDWVMARNRDEQIPVYHNDDVWGEGTPVKYEIYNACKEHVQILQEWIAEVEENGYTVKFEVI